eukprot:Nk52_evm1s2378 gene=Nk52_evmTU1s2378
MERAYEGPPEKKTRDYVEKCIADKVHEDDSGVIGEAAIHGLLNFDPYVQAIHDIFHIWQNLGK